MSTMRGWMAGLGAVWALTGCREASPDGSGAGGAQVREVIAQRLPAMDGGQLRTTIVEVSYGPGGRSAPHTHPCPVIGYVLEGALRTRTEGGTESVYRAGQSFYEPPNGVHAVSANASDREPVRFLATFVCDHDAPLSAPATGRSP